MKATFAAAALMLGVWTVIAVAQTPPSPTTMPTPPASPVKPPASSAAPASAEPAPAESAPAPADPTAAPRTGVVEGTLVQTQRVEGDRASFVWVCTYRVAGARRSVQLDASCPSTMPFKIKR